MWKENIQKEISETFYYKAFYETSDLKILENKIFL